MNEITKVSEITADDMADYLRLPDLTDEEYNTINTMIGVAKDYISKYTGRLPDELDNFQDFVIVVCVLVQDMWDTRTMYVDNSQLNEVVTTILGLHSVNLL